MIANIGTGVAPVNIAFSSSRSAALIERKVMQYTALSITLHHCTLSVIKTQLFPLLGVLDCVSIHCADQNNTQTRIFLTKSFDNTLQACVDMENEYLHAYNTGADVKVRFFCSLHHCKCAGFTMFLITFVLSI